MGREMNRLRNGPFRRGRGGLGEAARQQESERIDQANALRGAILEIPARVATFAGSYDAGSDGSERYIPWGSGGSATNDNAIHALMKPFADCKITRFSVMSETAPTVLVLRIYEYGGSPNTLYDSGIINASAGEVVTVSPDLTWPGDVALTFSVGPGVAIDEVGALVVVEEVT